MPMPLHQPFELPNLREPVTGKAKRLQNESAVQHGRDGKGKDGLVGFCIHLAVNHPRSHAGLLAKLLPLHVSNDNPSAALVGSIIINTIPAGFTHNGQAMSDLSPSFEHQSRPLMRVIEPER